MKKGLFLLVFALALTGCVNFAEQPNMPAVTYYVLQDSAPAAPAIPVAAGALKDSDPLSTKVRVESYVPTLLVLDTVTGGFYDTDQLIFSRGPGTRGQYQFARWTERPGKRFADLMRARLDRQGIWQVSAAGGYVQGDVLLDTELVEFYHDAASEPGQFRLELHAELVDLKRRKLLGRKVFQQQVSLATFDAAGAAQASNVAVSRTLDELAAWLATLR
jgi:cholesterol transport system auxiliary component